MFAEMRGSLREITSGLRNRSPLMLCGLALGVIVPLAFVLYTQEIWEDFLITYRFSENLARGDGLVFSPGERVHGFTSVINTLLPALVAWVTQASDYRVPLLVYRIVSLAGLLFALIAMVTLLGREENSSSWPRWAVLLFPLLAVLEVKITAFTMNGQEAGFMLGFLAPAFALAYLGWSRHGLLGGACFAGLMYTRPDGFVFIAAIAILAFATAAESRRAVALALGRSIAVAFVLYLPWLLFAWSYYGSPIPHTIIAKRGTSALPPIADGFALLGNVAAGLTLVVDRLCGALGAIYDYVSVHNEGDFPKWFHDVALLLESLAVTWWLVPTRDRLGRMASFLAFCTLGYLSVAGAITVVSPWYYPPLSFFSLLALVRIITFAGRMERRGAGNLLAAGLTLAVGGLLAFTFVNASRGLRIKQVIVDGGYRRAIGEWLRQNVSDTECVYLECLGYIGYFSQRKIHDWPGLVSPTVVAARRRIGHPPYPWGHYLWGKVAEEIQPDWIVARPIDMDQIKYSPQLSAAYSVVKVFDASQPVLAAGLFPGSVVAHYDALFFVLKRKVPRGAAPPPAPTAP